MGCPVGRRGSAAASLALGPAQRDQQCAFSACGRRCGGVVSLDGRRRVALAAPCLRRRARGRRAGAIVQPRARRRLARPPRLRGGGSRPWLCAAWRQRVTFSCYGGCASRSATSAAALRRYRSASSQSPRRTRCVSTRGCARAPLGSPIRPRAPARPHPPLNQRCAFSTCDRWCLAVPLPAASRLWSSRRCRHGLIWRVGRVGRGVWRRFGRR